MQLQVMHQLAAAISNEIDEARRSRPKTHHKSSIKHSFNINLPTQNRIDIAIYVSQIQSHALLLLRD